MLLLVTILLVVVGTISLVIGFIQTSRTLIFVSIGCSVLAAVVLLIFSRMTAKSQQVATSDGGPAPLDTGQPTGRSQTDDPFVGTGLLGSSPGEGSAPDGGHGDTAAGWTGQGGDDEDDVIVDDDFPIERYDTRRVGEILPLLAELDLDELDIVREHEEQGKGRATVLARIDQLIDQLETEDRHEEAHRFDDTTGAPLVHDAAPVGDDDHLEGADEDEEPPVDLEPLPGPAVTQAVSVAALPEDDGYFPIEDYDDLRSSEILPLLPELDDDELVMVQERERAGAARSSVLRRIDSLVATSSGPALRPEPQPEPELELEPEPEPEPELVPVPVPVLTSEVAAGGAKRAPAKRAASTRKTPAVKSAAPRAATRKVAPPVAPVQPVKKAPAARKAAASKALPPVPAKKAAPARATSVKASARKAPADVAKAPVAKKAPVVKVSAAAAKAGKGAAPATKVVKARKTVKG